MRDGVSLSGANRRAGLLGGAVTSTQIWSPVAPVLGGNLTFAFQLQ
ncbi:MAG: hypothetical protein ACE37K_01130 [Planctomycetota bacterium]